MLVQQQCLSSLPKREIQVFDGNPLQYHCAKYCTHLQYVESKTESPSDRLYFLEQYTRGHPREIIKSCQHMPADHGYLRAKALLQERFGDQYKNASAYLKNALSWANIKSEDLRALQDYSLFLRSCCNSMENIQYLLEMDTPSNMLTVVKKLPYKLREKWRSEVCELQETVNQRATFSDIVNFVERQVKIMTDPVFGNIQDVPTLIGSKSVNKGKSQSYLKTKRSSFATTVRAMERKSEIGTNRKEMVSLSNKSCLFCKCEHTLELCPLLEKRSHGEKISFLKENGICFGCMCTGHISKNCRNRLLCKVCNLKHPSILHIYPRENVTDSKQLRKRMDTVMGSAPESVESSGYIGAGEYECKLSIVPVQVKSKKGNKTVITYAFLDQGSTAVFCTSRLMNRLGLSGKRTNILLRTMGQEKVTTTHVVSGLEVAGLNEEDFWELPDAYTQETMPVHSGNIPKQKDLQGWPYLKHVNLPDIDSDIELLIGINAPRVMEPIQVIRSVDNGPYAIKTRLGWTVNGPLRGDGGNRSSSKYPDVTINRISVSNLENFGNSNLKLIFLNVAKMNKLGFQEKITSSLRW